MSDGSVLELGPPVKMEASERLRGLGLTILILLLEMKQLKNPNWQESNQLASYKCNVVVRAGLDPVTARL